MLGTGLRAAVDVFSGAVLDCHMLGPSPEQPQRRTGEGCGLGCGDCCRGLHEYVGGVGVCWGGRRVCRLRLDWYQRNSHLRCSCPTSVPRPLPCIAELTSKRAGKPHLLANANVTRED